MADDEPAKKKLRKGAKGSDINGNRDGSAFLGALTTGLELRDAYADALQPGPLPLTTHADDFAGCLDYCWVGRVADGRGEATVADDPAGSASTARTSLPAVLEVLSMPYEITQADAFGRIPSREWPSDHLAIGCTLGVPLVGSTPG